MVIEPMEPEELSQYKMEVMLAYASFRQIGYWLESKRFKTLTKKALMIQLQVEVDRNTTIPVNAERYFVRQIYRILKLWKDFRTGSKTYKLLREKLIPAMMKNHRAIEAKKPRKLESLADMFDVDEQYVKAHVIRTIVMPHVEQMNRRWREMTAMEKYEAEYHY